METLLKLNELELVILYTDLSRRSDDSSVVKELSSRHSTIYIAKERLIAFKVYLSKLFTKR